jgi:peptidyl-prolyl cis-trans isomerase A (cyclophilin A)
MRASLPLILVLLAPVACGACSKSEPEPSGLSVASAVMPPPGGGSPTPASAPTSSIPLAHVTHPDLLDPSKATAKAPDVFKAKLSTTKGDVVLEIHRDWSPNGADRFYNLVKMGFYDDQRFFRAVDGFMIQWGISGDPMVSAKWMNAGIPDDAPKQSNTRGMVTFAQSSLPNSRSTQVFISTVDNSRLDKNFCPFGKVLTGMEVMDSVYKGYGDGLPQGAIQASGNAFLDAKYPKLDGIKHAEIVP